VRFLDEQVGWVYGPALYETTDGGQTWSQEKLVGSVLDIEPIPGDDTWALVS
jgi:photosystem II stability/assembly factor-like uncharacterized protein